MRQLVSSLQGFPFLGVALAPVLAILAFCLRVDNALMLLLESQGGSDFFLYGCLAGTLFRCALYLLSLKGTGRSTHRKTVWMIDLLLGILGLGLVLFLSTTAPPSANIPISGLAGALIGISLLGQLWQWGFLYFRLFPVHTTLLVTSAAFLLASILWLVCIIITIPLLFIAILTGLFIAGSLVLYRALLFDAHTGRSLAPATATSSSGTHKDTRLAWMELRSVMVFGWSALVGLLFNFFTLGLTFRPFSAGLTEGFLMPKPIAYLIVVAVALYLLRIVRDPTEVLGLLCRVVLPITAAITLASPFLERLVAFGSLPALSFIPYLGIAPFNVLGTVTLFSLLQKTRLIGTRVWPRLMTRMCATVLAACACSMAAGMAIFKLMGTDAQIVSLCILSVFLVLMVLVAILEGYGRGYGRTDEVLPPTRDQQNTHCDSLATRYSLSAREREVLGFLARGHGTRWIAEHLCISPETVRTHCKRIYEKTGVHTKEELLCRIEEQETAPR